MPENSPGTVDFLTNPGMKALAAVAILIVGWLIAAWAQKTVRNHADQNPVLDETLAIFLGKIASVLILVVTMIAVLNQFGVQTASLVALLGTA